MNPITHDHINTKSITDYKTYPLQPDYTPLFRDLEVVERKLWRVHKAAVSGSLTQQKTSYLLAEIGTDLTATRLLQRRMRQDHEKALTDAAMLPKPPTVVTLSTTTELRTVDGFLLQNPDTCPNER